MGDLPHKIFSSAVRMHTLLGEQFAKATVNLQGLLKPFSGTSFTIAEDGSNAVLHALGRDFLVSYNLYRTDPTGAAEFRIAIPATSVRGETLLWRAFFDVEGNVRLALDDKHAEHLTSDATFASKALAGLTTGYLSHVQEQ